MVPDVRALIMGPTDEDPEYFEECRALVGQLGMSTTVEFTGAVAIGDWLPQVDVVALTSLSEAQPLVLLEAGAAAIPCVATNVGSCAEILLGHPSEVPNLGQGGIITDVVASADIARAMHTLLSDKAMRRSYGEALRERVRAAYSNERAIEAYRDLYDRAVNAATREA
jgi:glycosyltransferase involved in cell wall biosynthesis